MASYIPPFGTGAGGAHPPQTIHQPHGTASAAAPTGFTPFAPAPDDDSATIPEEEDADDDNGYPHSDDGYASASDVDVAGDGTYSLTPSITDYVYQDGRSFHRFREGRYHFPNDGPEQRRELMKHDTMMLLRGVRLHYARCRTRRESSMSGRGSAYGPRRLTAVTCKRAVGDKYPGAAVVGLDLSPIQFLMQPPNVTFIIDDAEDEWDDPPNTLDFVRLGNMAPSIRDWPKLFRSAYT
ncbi:methyltransferase domain-containing protein [Colletotrichum tofieldiae]|nr:methyltransferase domain-containing protein [Colletotrichum tofieldiae]